MVPDADVDIVYASLTILIATLGYGHYTPQSTTEETEVWRCSAILKSWRFNVKTLIPEKNFNNSNIQTY